VATASCKFEIGVRKNIAREEGEEGGRKIHVLLDH